MPHALVTWLAVAGTAFAVYQAMDKFLPCDKCKAPVAKNATGVNGGDGFVVR